MEEMLEKMSLTTSSGKALLLRASLSSSWKNTCTRQQGHSPLPMGSPCSLVKHLLPCPPPAGAASRRQSARAEKGELGRPVPCGGLSPWGWGRAAILIPPHPETLGLSPMEEGSAQQGPGWGTHLVQQVQAAHVGLLRLQQLADDLLLLRLLQARGASDSCLELSLKTGWLPPAFAWEALLEGYRHPNSLSRSQV